MQISPYVMFNGNCEEAFRFYEKSLGGTLNINKFGNSPMSGQVPAEWQEKVMHARLVAEGAELMGSDTAQDYQGPQGSSCPFPPTTQRRRSGCSVR